MNDPAITIARLRMERNRLADDLAVVTAELEHAQRECDLLAQRLRAHDASELQRVRWELAGRN